MAPQRPASRVSLAYEARAAGLLEQALKRTAANQRAAFWRDIVARDGILAPLLRNAKIRKPLESIILSSW